jgi:glycosyltransferase involved in cell wall biosynthesis
MADICTALAGTRSAYPVCGLPNLTLEVPIRSGRARKTVLLNATTINKGGGIQAVASFIRTLIDQFDPNDGVRWIFAVSAEVRDQLAEFEYFLREGVDLCLARSPAKDRQSRRELREFANRQADLVFTFFGPAYVVFRCPHLCGVADGWVTHSSRLAYSTLPTLQRKLRMALLSTYKALWFRRANYWVVEQDIARAGLLKRLGLPANNIRVVSNNCSQVYIDERAAQAARPLQSIIRVLTFAANFPNKCLDLIPTIAALLVRQHHIANVQFVLTVPASEFAGSAIPELASKLAVEPYIRNVGYVPLKHGPALYRSCDIVLMPSVLETFSATYPESMHMGLPIVTSDLDFARAICRDAALYFRPRDATSAAATLAMLIGSYEIRTKLVAAGFDRARDFPTPSEKYLQYASFVDEILDGNPAGRRAHIRT